MNSKSNYPSKEGTKILIANSAKDFPAQILLPPKKGMKVIGCLFLPSGVKNKGDLGSNLSGIH